jgi:hypothetical protein
MIKLYYNPSPNPVKVARPTLRNRSGRHAQRRVVLGDDAWASFPNLKRWFDLVSARPAAVRANALKDKYTFKTDMDADARRHMFRHVSGA